MVYNDLVVRVFFAQAFQAKNSQCRFDFSFGDRKKAVASLSTTLLYIEYNKYFTNSKYQPFNLIPFFTLDSTVQQQLTSEQGWTSMESVAFGMDVS